MLDALSIRLKIILLSGSCLLGIIGLIVSINLHQSKQNNRLISASSSKMLTDSGENLLQAKAAEQASNLQRVFGNSVLLISALSDQAANLRNMAAQRGLPAATLREELNQSVKTASEHSPQIGVLAGVRTECAGW
jgi:methyl-accepting chemotaxis protein